MEGSRHPLREAAGWRGAGCRGRRQHAFGRFSALVGLKRPFSCRKHGAGKLAKDDWHYDRADECWYRA